MAAGPRERVHRTRPTGYLARRLTCAYTVSRQCVSAISGRIQEPGCGGCRRHVSGRVCQLRCARRSHRWGPGASRACTSL